jgi:hypothetical protein
MEEAGPVLETTPFADPPSSSEFRDERRLLSDDDEQTLDLLSEIAL